MSTLANITSLNLSLQTGGAALAVKAAKSVAKPARTVYVYGTADDVAPNFTTPAGAITYAQSLTPQIPEPVVVRCFTKADGTPYELSDFDSNYEEYAEIGIYLTSDFVRMNKTPFLPETLPPGLTVWYIDPNGVETLWVGHADGSAWPARGWKEFTFAVNSGSDGFASVSIDEVFGGNLPTLNGRFSNTRTFTSSIFSGIYDIFPVGKNVGSTVVGVLGYASLSRVESTTVNLTMVQFNNDGTIGQSLGTNAGFSIRVYP
jgi:hypothetical protein